MRKFPKEEQRQRAQPVQIGAKGDGEELQGVARATMVEDEVDLGIEDAVLVEEVEVEVLEVLVSIPWHATAAIWPVTIPLLVARQ